MPSITCRKDVEMAVMNINMFEDPAAVRRYVAQRAVELDAEDLLSDFGAWGRRTPQGSTR